ncbi:hypothetical protein MSAR_46680 [Mycolicibacterium sarraceniae]|uniref:Uncharacterized protein n=1 Tax=Mycolicibacterium sarraceniae TaxID=1534348 RepID=A0A7I7SWX3_9MYCO|nr:hypothetical protein MSAR_46680 [Mycolicibacterium sarraceniae]
MGDSRAAATRILLAARQGCAIRPDQQGHPTGAADVGQVVTTAFPLSGLTAIGDQHGIVGKGEHDGATLRSAQPNASVRLRRRHAKNTAKRSGATRAVSGDMFTIK